MASNSGSRIGEVVLLEFPYTNQAGSKLRPAVILAQSSGQFADLTVAYKTSEVENYCWDDAAVVVERADLDAGTIRKPSVVRVDKTLVIDSRKVKRSGVAQLCKAKIDEILRSWARIVVNAHYKGVHASAREKFTPGQSRINYAGRVYDEKEMINLVDSALDFWLTAGRYDREFCKKFSAYLNTLDMPEVKSVTVNSGSSANLLAIASLTSPKLGDLKISEGDEVITVAAGFPTSIAPIVQNNLVPVFVDIKLGTYNIDAEQIEKAITKKQRPFFWLTPLECHLIWIKS